MFPGGARFLDIGKCCTYNKIIVDIDIKFCASPYHCICPSHSRCYLPVLQCLLIRFSARSKNRAVAGSRFSKAVFFIRLFVGSFCSICPKCLFFASAFAYGHLILALLGPLAGSW